MISNIFNQKALKILTYFLISPGSRNTRSEIKEKTKMNNVQLDETLKFLLFLKIIKRERKLYLLDFESEKFAEILNAIKKEYAYFNLPYKIFNLLVELSSSLSNINEINSIILFGSYSKLIYSVKSDIDIAVILDDNAKNKEKIEKIIEEKAKKLEKKNKEKIEIHFFAKKDMKANDPLIKDILKNGKSLTY